MTTVGNFLFTNYSFRFMSKTISLQAKATKKSSTQDEKQQNLETEVQNYEISQMLHHLAPWIEKTNGEESVGAWETTMATKMMVKLLELWLTQESRERVEKMLAHYHPLDRAAMAYALVVYMMTGTKMTFKSVVAKQQYKTVCQMLKEDMPQLMFAGHMKYIIRKYGKVKG